MIKTAIITIAALSTTAGTAFTAPAVMPNNVNVIAGALSVSKGPLGTKLSIAPKPGFAIVFTTQAGRNITIRF